MKHRLWLFALMIALSGCSTTALPYKPQSQPAGVFLSADYVILADRLRVEVDTGGYRLEDAQIVKADKAAVRPQTIEQPPAYNRAGSGFGIGLGGGTFGGGSGVGGGAGVGVSIPMGGDTRVSGNTVLYFPLDQIGPAPWRLTVRVSGTNPAEIVLPPR